jgi:AcrR family transcriptional regulator
MTKQTPKTKAPGRIPTQERAIFTRKSILEAVERVLEEKGIADASTDEIARRAGVGVGTLYQYFPTREALFAAWEEQVLSDEMQRLQALVQERIDAPLEPLVFDVVRMAASAVARVSRLHGESQGEANLVSRQERRAELAKTLVAFLRGVFEARRDELWLDDLDTAPALLVTTVFNSAFYGAIEHPEMAASGAWQRELARMVTRYLVRPRVTGVV